MNEIKEQPMYFGPVCSPQRWGGKLDGAVCYLSGPMGYADDGGVGWRKWYIDAVRKAGMKVGFLDPCNKPKELNNDYVGLEFEYCAKLKQEGRWEELTQLVNTFRHQDLRFIDNCDFVVVYINRKVHTCGTYDEIFMAERQQKPIFAIVEGGKKECPDWLFGAIRWQEMFDTFEESVNHLLKIHRGEVTMDSRWILVHKYLLSTM